MSGTRFEEVLQRAERLIQSCGEAPLPLRGPPQPVAFEPATWAPSPAEPAAPGPGAPQGELWPPEQPPSAPLVFQTPAQPAFGIGGLLEAARLGARRPGDGSPASDQSRPRPPEEPSMRHAWRAATEPVAGGFCAGAAGAAGPAFAEPRAEPQAAGPGPLPGLRPGRTGGPPLGAALAAGLTDGRSPAEAAVLFDGLERENLLLRQQLDRCHARERALRAESDELRRQLEVQERAGQQRRELETASLAAVVQRQGEVAEAAAARLEALRGEGDAQEQQLATLRAQTLEAQAEAELLVEELESLRQFVLPGAPADAEPPPGSHSGGRTEELPALQATLAFARRATARLRLACEAKLETLGQLHQQLRQRLEEVAGPRTPGLGLGAYRAGVPATPVHAADSRLGAAASFMGPGASTGLAGLQETAAALASAAETEARLRCELRQARAEAEEGRARALEASRQLQAEGESQSQLARDLEAATRSLRVKEAEVRELQLLGKYFAGRSKTPPQRELDVAGLAEELRGRCVQLSQELERTRAERDLLRAERAGADRWAAPPGSSLTGHSALGGGRLPDGPRRATLAC